MIVDFPRHPVYGDLPHAFTDLCESVIHFASKSRRVIIWTISCIWVKSIKGDNSQSLVLAMVSMMKPIGQITRTLVSRWADFGAYRFRISCYQNSGPLHAG